MITGRKTWLALALAAALLFHPSEARADDDTAWTAHMVPPLLIAAALTTVAIILITSNPTDSNTNDAGSGDTTDADAEAARALHRPFPGLSIHGSF